jgi:ribosome biogenesis GTPase
MSRSAHSATPAEFDARVIATFGRQSLVKDAQGEVWSATRRGRRGDVVVGDQVRARAVAAGQARIDAVHPRRTLLFRADAHRVKELAANIDCVLVVFATRPTFNAWFVWKALVAASAAGIDAIAVQNKTDLDDGGHAERFRVQLAALGVPTLALSAKAAPEKARSDVGAAMGGRAGLLVGQSGMGKSTLLNLLVPDARVRTQHYSERLDVGKQTTTAARWFDLPEGGSIVDTPGFQEFGLGHLSLGNIARAFPEFAPALGRCRFADCRHLAEPDCAVRTLADAGEISTDRLAFYRSLAEGSLR